MCLRISQKANSISCLARKIILSSSFNGEWRVPGGPRGLQNRWEAVKPSPVCSIRTLSAIIRQNPATIPLPCAQYPYDMFFVDTHQSKAWDLKRFRIYIRTLGNT